jgi:hypothetical protein
VCCDGPLFCLCVGLATSNQVLNITSGGSVDGGVKVISEDQEYIIIGHKSGPCIFIKAHNQGWTLGQCT